MLGKNIYGYTENIKRAQYNKMIKNYYKDKPIFDIAEVESKYPDGRRESFELHGQTFYALVPQYTYDGGHLNEMGRKVVAKELINVLSTCRIMINKIGV